MEIKEIEAEIEKKLDVHFVKSKQYCFEVMDIVWNVSFIMRKYSDDDTIKQFAKNIVLSIQTCHLTIDEMWETVNR